MKNQLTLYIKLRWIFLNVVRPSAGDGWWLCYLLLAAYLVNCWKFEKSTTFEYKVSTVLAFGLVLQTETIHFNTKKNGRLLQLVFHLIAPIVTCLLLIFLLNQGMKNNLISIKWLIIELLIFQFLSHRIHI